ncbi:MAG: DNA polymerase IV [Thermodesulfobacteriota bacterium]|nr:DNA polymerase IV [Thermodesulfobacteriota bacterium]
MENKSIPRTIMHLDMDAFFAAVEVLDNPALSGKCLVVGGHSKRGVVAAASYEARRYGIHSAMPMFQARRLCADIVVVAPRRKRYGRISRQVMAIIRTVSPRVEQISIDEAYADVTGCERLHGPPGKMAKDLKQRIKNAIRLTCSIGIAPNKFLAKIASDMDKPDGLTVVEPEDVPGFIQALPIQKVPGVGKHTWKILNEIGVRTLGDIAAYPETMLYHRFGKFGRRLVQLAGGIEETPVTPQAPAKSISGEETLAVDTQDKEKLKTHLMRHAEDVGRQLRQINLKARTVTLKIKHSDFKQVTRSKTIKRATHSTEIIYREANQLLTRYRLTRPVRLIGMGVSSLTTEDTPEQLDLFGSRNDKNTSWEQVDRVVDAITDKFGQNSIHKARLKEIDP